MATKIVIVGGGFGGAYTAYHLERYLPAGAAEVTLVSRDNYFLMTPLLFEAGSGELEFRHAVNPVRPMLRSTRFVNAGVDRIDLAGRTVHATSAGGDGYALPYDHLVLALGQRTDTARIPGSEHALPFKTVADAIAFRSRVIEAFERADAEADPARRAKALSFVVVGGGLVGVELMGELTDFTARLLKTYRRVRPDEVRLELLQHGPAILPEMKGRLADYAAAQFARRGVRVRVNTGAERIEPGRVHLPGGEVVEAGVVVLAAGLAPNPVVAALDLPKDRGRVKTDGCMRVEGHPGVWAVGDCAAVPGPDGKPYPTLAQHALREAKQLAKNIAAVIAGTEPRPFVYHTLGTMAALGRHRGIADLMGVKVRGFLAWWVWRSYYLLQMAGLERKLRVALDWTASLVLRPDAVKIDLPGPPADPAPSRTEEAAAGRTANGTSRPAGVPFPVSTNP